MCAPRTGRAGLFRASALGQTIIQAIGGAAAGLVLGLIAGLTYFAFAVAGFNIDRADVPRRYLWPVAAIITLAFAVALSLLIRRDTPPPTRLMLTNFAICAFGCYVIVASHAIGRALAGAQDLNLFRLQANTAQSRLRWATTHALAARIVGLALVIYGLWRLIGR